MTDLTDRMRTCAAHIRANDAHDRDDGAGLVLRDAAALLIEAAGVLEQTPVPLGEPMEIIPPVAASLTKKEDWTLDTQGTWVAPGASLPFEQAMAAAQARSNPRACPKCDSRAWKKVTHQGKQVLLTCGVCGEQWEWRAS